MGNRLADDVGMELLELGDDGLERRGGRNAVPQQPQVDQRLLNLNSIPTGATRNTAATTARRTISGKANRSN